MMTRIAIKTAEYFVIFFLFAFFPLFFFLQNTNKPFRNTNKQFSRNIRISNGYIRCGNTEYCAIYFFDMLLRKDGSLIYDKNNIDSSEVRFKTFTNNFYINNNDKIHVEFAGFSDSPCFGILFANEIYNPNNHEMSPVHYLQNGCFSYANHFRIDFRKCVITDEVTGKNIETPPFDGKVYILTPEGKFLQTEYTVMNLYAFHLHCNSGQREDIGSFFGGPLGVSCYELIDFGPYRDFILEQEWFKTVKPLLDANMFLCKRH